MDRRGRDSKSLPENLLNNTTMETQENTVSGPGSLRSSKPQRSGITPRPSHPLSQLPTVLPGPIEQGDENPRSDSGVINSQYESVLHLQSTPRQNASPAVIRHTPKRATSTAFKDLSAQRSIAYRPTDAHSIDYERSHSVPGECFRYTGSVNSAVPDDRPIMCMNGGASSQPPNISKNVFAHNQPTNDQAYSGKSHVPSQSQLAYNQTNSGITHVSTHRQPVYSRIPSNVDTSLSSQFQSN